MYTNQWQNGNSQGKWKNKKIKTFNNQRIYKHADPQNSSEPQNPDFTYVLKVLRTDPDLKIFIQTLQSKGIDLIMLKYIQENNNAHGTDIEELVFHDTLSNEKMFLWYINYNINEECETFKDLFKIDNKYNDYKDNSCFLNIIISTNRDNFQKKRFKRNIKY